MRRTMLLAATLVMSVAFAVPAVAQSTGTSAVSCSTVVQDGQGIVRYSGVVDGVEVSGSVPVQGSSVSVNCKQLVEEAAAAKVAETNGAQAEAAPKAEAKAAPEAEAKAGGAQAKAGEAKSQLPATGGAAMISLGAGVLLAAGLLALRVFR